MTRIQIITIVINFVFIAYIARLITKGKLREEYAIVWCLCTFVLILFSFWTGGLALMSKIFGVFDPPNLVFTAFIFIILIYLLHLSVVSSKSHHSITRLTQELALMKEKMRKEESRTRSQESSEPK
jgi:hypothetical protein